MSNMKTFEQIYEVNRITPALVTEDADVAVRIAELLVENGVDTMEVSIVIPHALEVIEKIADKVPDMFIGAASIKSAGDFLTAYNAGADYIISPGCTNELFVAARSHRSVIRYLPGVLTPSEAMLALNEGFNIVKFFPAADFNGYKVLQSLHAPLPEIKFCPKGGVTLANMKQYLELPNVLAVGMKDIVHPDLLKEGNFSEIERRVKEAVTIVKDVANKQPKPQNNDNDKNA